jgi:electron transport complex protein RnfG
MKTVFEGVLRSAIRLAVFCGLIVALIASISFVTRDRIQLERKQASERILKEVAGQGNIQLAALAHDVYITTDNLGRTGFIVPAVTQQGYNGEIKLWVGVDQLGKITGVRVVEHRETPGLGDKMLLQVSDWITGFNGKSLENPTSDGWQVRKDGGEFDQFTGATITPRAIVQAVHHALIKLKSGVNLEHLQ